MGKVQKIKVIVVPKYITEDREVQLYLAPKKRRILPRVWRIVKWGACRLWEYIKQGACRFLIRLFRCFITLSITIIVGTWTITGAYYVRGYWACGGEYLFIMFVMYGSYKILKVLELVIMAQSVVDAGLNDVN